MRQANPNGAADTLDLEKKSEHMHGVHLRLSQ